MWDQQAVVEAVDSRQVKSSDMSKFLISFVSFFLLWRINLKLPRNKSAFTFLSNSSELGIHLHSLWFSIHHQILERTDKSSKKNISYLMKCRLLVLVILWWCLQLNLINNDMLA